MSTYKIRVISLPDAKERQASIEKQLHEHGLAVEIFDAVDGRLGEHPLLERYCQSEYILNYGRAASAGEIGCYASHYLMWQYCVEHNCPVVVLEDDAFFHDSFSEGFALVLDNIDTLGFIRLQKPDKSSRFYTIKERGQHRLVKYIKAPQSTLGYILTPRVAQHFIENSDTFTMPVDVFIRRFYIHAQAIYGMLPEIVYASIFPTGIGDRGRDGNKNVRTRLVILGRKFKGLALMGLTNLKHYFCGPHKHM